MQWYRQYLFCQSVKELQKQSSGKHSQQVQLLIRAVTWYQLFVLPSQIAIWHQSYSIQICLEISFIICSMSFVIWSFQTRKTTNGVLQWTPLFQRGQHVSRSHRSKWFHSRMKKLRRLKDSGSSNYHLSLLKLTQMSDIAKWRKMDLQQPCVTQAWNLT